MLSEVNRLINRSIRVILCSELDCSQDSTGPMFRLVFFTEKKSLNVKILCQGKPVINFWIKSYQAQKFVSELK